MSRGKNKSLSNKRTSVNSLRDIDERVKAQQAAKKADEAKRIRKENSRQRSQKPFITLPDHADSLVVEAINDYLACEYLKDEERPILEAFLRGVYQGICFAEAEHDLVYTVYGAIEMAGQLRIDKWIDGNENIKTPDLPSIPDYRYFNHEGEHVLMPSKDRILLDRYVELAHKELGRTNDALLIRKTLEKRGYTTRNLPELVGIAATVALGLDEEEDN